MQNPEPAYLPRLPEELRNVLIQEGIGEEQLSHRYSDLFIEADDREQLARIADAREWRGMAEIFTSETTGKPTLEIGLALLGHDLPET